MISILKLHEEELLEMKFEQILTFMNDLMRGEFLVNRHFEEVFVEKSVDINSLPPPIQLDLHRV